MDEPYALLYSGYLDHITSALGSLRDEEDMVDVTLSCEGKKIKAHKILLSACSPYFHDIFKENPCQHPVIVFRNVKYKNLKAIVDFIYCGKVHLLHEELESFLEIADVLQIKGLTHKENESQIVFTDETVQAKSVGGLNHRKSKETRQENPPMSKTPNSPPAKKRKSNSENSVQKSPELNAEFRDIKEEVELVDVDVALNDDLEEDISFIEPSGSKQNIPETSKEPGPIASNAMSTAHSSQDSDISQLKSYDMLSFETVMTQMKETIDRLESKVDLLQGQRERNNRIRPDVLNSFGRLPAATKEDFEELEKQLKNDHAFKQNLARLCSTLTNSDGTVSTSSILRKLITDDVAEEYSLTGKHHPGGPPKKKFIETESYRLIFEVCMETLGSKFNNSAIRQVVGEWLQQAKFRKVRREKRSNQENNSSEVNFNNDREEPN